MSYKIIFIDWHNTLSRSLFWEQLRASDPPTYEKIGNWMLDAWKNTTQHWMLGEYTSETVVGQMSKDIKVPYDYLLEQFIMGAEKMEWASPKLPDLIQVIRNNGTKVVIATDNMDSFERFTVPAMKINELFDGYLVSSNIGHLKDEPELNGIAFFDQFLLENGATYKDVVLLDDSVDKGKFKLLGFDRVIIDSTNKLEEVLESYARA